MKIHHVKGCTAFSEYCGEYIVISDEPCECCGDIVDEYVLDLDT